MSSKSFCFLRKAHTSICQKPTENRTTDRFERHEMKFTEGYLTLITFEKLNRFNIILKQYFLFIAFKNSFIETMNSFLRWLTFKAYFVYTVKWIVILDVAKEKWKECHESVKPFSDVSFLNFFSVLLIVMFINIFLIQLLYLSSWSSHS